MTQTSDDCPNNGSSGMGCNASTSSSNSRSMVIGAVDRNKAEKEKGDRDIFPICVAANASNIQQDELQPEEPAEPGLKVMQTEESARLTGKGEEKSDAAGIVYGDDITANTTSSPTSTNKLLSTDGSGSAISNGVVAEMKFFSHEQADTTAAYTFSKIPMCAVCFEPCICYCKTCKKVSYCSKEHQKRHWKQHRQECYPVTVQVNSVFGSHLVVTRDIKRGEVILCEKPLVAVPFLNHLHYNKPTIFGIKNDDGEDPRKSVPPADFSVCLVCHKVLWEEKINESIAASPPHFFSTSTCSKCRWPICCLECEKHPIHADQECKIFAEYHVMPSALCDKDTQYLCVALLRVLKHKKECDPASTTLAVAATASNSKWSQFMDVVNKQVPMKDGLNSQLAEAKKTTARFSDLIKKSLGSIIYNEFGVTDAEIDQIVQTLRTSSFITDNDGYYINGFSELVTADNRSSSSYNNGIKAISRGNSNGGKFLTVYNLASMITSNCIPNASWIIQQPSLDFYLRASTAIKTGERITITLVDPLLGTRERRELLWKEKYLSCCCTRCSDPTESCTFFSAIKCPGKKVGTEQAKATANRNGSECGVICECEGYVLPTDPLAVPQEEPVRSHEKEDSLPGEKLCEERMAGWKCNVCLMIQPWGFVQNSLERMKKIFTVEPDPKNVCFTMNIENDGSCDGVGSGGGNTNANKAVPDESKQGGNESTTPPPPVASPSCIDLDILGSRAYKIDSLVGNVVHANHYYILKKENEILNSISKLLEKGQVPFEEMEKWAVIMIELCKKGLKVVNVLCPGLSRERGRLLYFLQQGLTISLLFKTSRAMRIIMNPTTDSMSSSKIVNYSNKEVLSHDELMKKFYEVSLARKEVLEIFAMTKDNSRDREMLKAVQQDPIEVRLLKNYFKTHQHVS